MAYVYDRNIMFGKTVLSHSHSSIISKILLIHNTVNLGKCYSGHTEVFD